MCVCVCVCVCVYVYVWGGGSLLGGGAILQGVIFWSQKQADLCLYQNRKHVELNVLNYALCHY